MTFKRLFLGSWRGKLGSFILACIVWYMLKLHIEDRPFLPENVTPEEVDRARHAT